MKNMQYAVCIMLRCQTEMKYDNNKNQSYEQKCGNGQHESETELLRNISFSLYLVGYLFVWRCSGQPVPYFSLNFWMGELCLLFLPLKKMRRRSSWEREGVSTSLQLASVWRALPVVVVVVDNCLKVYMYVNLCEK